jgi:hypothetical protein
MLTVVATWHGAQFQRLVKRPIPKCSEFYVENQIVLVEYFQNITYFKLS